jgi:hypothetical protein
MEVPSRPGRAAATWSPIGMLIRNERVEAARHFVPLLPSNLLRKRRSAGSRGRCYNQQNDVTHLRARDEAPEVCPLSLIGKLNDTDLCPKSKI